MRKTLHSGILLGVLAFMALAVVADDPQRNVEGREWPLRNGFGDREFKAVVIKALGNRKSSPTNELMKADPVDLIESLRLPRARVARDLSGIEQLSGLTNLDCSYQDIKGLDLSMCTNLISLDCRGAGLRSLDLTGAASLKIIQCDDNGWLAKVRLPSSTNLLALSCYGSGLTDIDVSRYPLMSVLVCYAGDLTNIDVAGCVGLVDLKCFSNRLTSLDVTTCTQLRILDCSNNRLKGTLDLSLNTNLVEVDVSSNCLSEIVVWSTNRLPAKFKYDKGVAVRERKPKN